MEFSNSQIETWLITTPKLAKNEIEINNGLVKMLENASVSELIAAYTYVTPDEIRNLFQIDRSVFGSFSGTGIDLGGGIGCVSSAVSTFPAVVKVFCLEYSAFAATIGQSRVFQYDTKGDTSKIVTVIGSFDELNLPDQSLDFAVAWDSLHHSENLDVTLGEIHRVLSCDSTLIIVDRAHSDNVSDEYLSSLLDIEYSIDFKKQNFIDEQRIVTRRDNGEHEYRVRDWKFSLEKSGFRIDSIKFYGMEKSKYNDLPVTPIQFDLGGFDAGRMLILSKKICS